MMELPGWKVHLLERRRKEGEEIKKKEREEEDRLSKMPAWKREIIQRRKAKAEASLSESREEVEGHQEKVEEVEEEKVEEEREVRVLTENIGPVLQNPFIQLEKQRRVPDPSCARPKPDPAGNRTPVRADNITERDPPTPGKGKNAEGLEVFEEDSPSLGEGAEDRRGRVGRLLGRFGRPQTEGENGGPDTPHLNGEEAQAWALNPPVAVVELEIQASTSPAPPPSCLRAATGCAATTQETARPPLCAPASSPSCPDSEPASLSPCEAYAAMSRPSLRPRTTDEARPLPFHLRPASASAARALKPAAQASPGPAGPEPFQHGGGQAVEDGEGGPGLRSIACPPWDRRSGGESQAVQRRKGNTITVNPRKMAPCENGCAVGETRASPARPEPVKKRYPTADEIKVIGGYQALGRSCLAKHTRDKKKLNISFHELALDSTYEYPSESAFLAEFGPLDECDSPAGLPHPEEDEEEESVLLGGIMRRKALIVDESCKR